MANPNNNENSEYQAPVQNNSSVINGNRPGERVTDTPEQLVRFQIEEILKTVRTGMPGIVQKSFERDGAVWLEIQPALSGKKRAELGGEEVRLPIVRAPLGVMNLGGFTINLPTPVNGDEVWITCADRSIQTFVKQGGVGVPETVSILTLNNAFAIPFSASNVKRKRVGEATDLTITGDGKAVINTDSIELNGNSKTFVTYAELNTALQLFVTALNLHVHSGVTTGPGSSGPPAASMSIDISNAETTTVKTGG